MKVRRTEEGDIEVVLEGSDLNRLERDLVRNVGFEGGTLSIVVDHQDTGEPRANQHAPKDTW